jgi:hypothetical protein
MSRRAADPATRARLDRLRTVARMKADAALARLAIGAGARAAAAVARRPGARRGAAGPRPAGRRKACDPAMVQARLAHRRWLDAQRRMLNERLALVQAEFLTLRPQAQRAFGRAEVLDRLRDGLRARPAQKAARRDRALIARSCGARNA